MAFSIWILIEMDPEAVARAPRDNLHNLDVIDHADMGTGDDDIVNQAALSVPACDASLRKWGNNKAISVK